MGYIYKITNTINNKFYIGLTSRLPRERFKDHKWNSIHRNKDCNNKFYNAINKHGIDNFKISIIEEIDNSLLDEREIYWISELNPEYNTSKGGKSTKGFLGKKLSKEHQDSIVKANSKSVYQYSLSGEFIKSFSSSIEANKELTGRTRSSSINHTLNNKQETALGFRWFKEYLGEKIEALPKRTSHKAKKVVQIDSEGNVVKIWNTALETELFGYISSKISLCCRGLRSKHKNYKWVFYDNFTNNM